MLRFPLLVALSVASASFAAFLPDTGLSVHASGFPFDGRQSVQIRLQNLGRANHSDLELRFFLTGDSADVADFAFRVDLGFKYLSSGFRSVDGIGRIDSATRDSRTAPSSPGCTKNCQMVLAIPLTGLTLAPLESFRLDLVPDKFMARVGLLNEPPTHTLAADDWSLSGIPLDGARESEVMERGDGPVASHIQVLSMGRVVWGNAPGEPGKIFPSPWKRAGLATTIDAIRIPFADSVSQRTRDSANLKQSRILVNQAGYRETDVKEGLAWIQAIKPSATTFSVINGSGSNLGTGTLSMKSASVTGQIGARGSNWAGAMNGGDLAHSMSSESRYGTLYQARIPSSLPSGGPYRIAAGSDTSMPFRVDDRIYGWVRDAELRFFGIQRSGDGESWMHGPSHLDDVAPGGWYDCGDQLKEGTTQAYAMAVLGALAVGYPERDADRTAYNHDSMRTTDGVPDLLRELKHGADFVVGSWIRNNRSPTGTITSVGDSGPALNGWFPADWSDILPASMGGQASRTGFVDMGANVQASFAAGLAFFATAWNSRDAKASDDALESAKAFYASAKANPRRQNSSKNYASATNAYGSLALAATALLMATHDTTYLNDLAYDTTLGKPTFADSSKFEGGWLANTSLYLTGMGRDNLVALALPMFHRLILRDSAAAAAFGVSAPRERRRLELQAALAMGASLSNLGGPVRAGSTDTIGLPRDAYGRNLLSFDSLWYSLPPPLGVSGFWNTYQAAAIATLFLYADIASDLEDGGVPSPTAGTGWNAQRVRGLATRSLDGLLGVNPWDLSLVHGIGSKNPNHPHHRTSNPEGRNLPFAYTYQTPIGAVHPGVDPSTYALTDSYSASSSQTEPCLEGSASLLVPAVLLSRAEPTTSSVWKKAASNAMVPTFSASPTRRGARLRWSNTTGIVQAVVVDVAGRQVARISTKEGHGDLEIPLPRLAGQRFLKMSDAIHAQVFTLPGF